MSVWQSAIRQDLYFYFDHIESWDYVMIACALAGFLVLMVLSFFLIVRSHLLGSLLLLCGLGFFGWALPFGYNFVDDTLRARSLELVSLKQLQYSDTMLADFNLTNLSKKTFRWCRVNIKFYKNKKSELKALIAKFKPMKMYFATTNERIAPNESIDFNMTIRNFRPSDYNVSIYSQCF